MLIRAPLYEPLATKSGRAGYTLYRYSRLSQRLDHPIEKASNESTEVGGKGSVRGGKPVSAWCYEAQRRRCSKLGQLGGKRKKGEGGRSKR
jgi:hypothetical protein